MLIAITGNVGSGKSRVAAILAASLRCPTIDSDQVCRELLEPGRAGWRALRERWPDRFLGDDGLLDRQALRQAVFSEPEIRQGLEQILHPLVRDTVTRAASDPTCRPHMLVEVPLLFEVGWQDDFDALVTVYAGREMCLVRTMARDRVSRPHTEAILALQINPEAKAAMSDWVIDNSGIWSSTVLQVHWLVHQLRALDLPRRTTDVFARKKLDSPGDSTYKRGNGDRRSPAF
jgi:dephospho-CoA kinase